MSWVYVALRGEVLSVGPGAGSRPSTAAMVNESAAAWELGSTIVVSSSFFEVPSTCAPPFALVVISTRFAHAKRQNNRGTRRHDPTDRPTAYWAVL